MGKSIDVFYDVFFSSIHTNIKKFLKVYSIRLFIFEL